MQSLCFLVVPKYSFVRVDALNQHQCGVCSDAIIYLCVFNLFVCFVLRNFVVCLLYAGF